MPFNVEGGRVEGWSRRFTLSDQSDAERDALDSIPRVLRISTIRFENH